MHKFFEFLTEAIGWLQIVASPLLIGIAIGALIYFQDPSADKLLVGISIATAGLIVGILWATKIWRTKGTNWFVSRIMATSEPNNDNSSSEKWYKTVKDDRIIYESEGYRRSIQRKASEAENRKNLRAKLMSNWMIS